MPSLADGTGQETLLRTEQGPATLLRFHLAVAREALYAQTEDALLHGACVRATALLGCRLAWGGLITSGPKRRVVPRGRAGDDRGYLDAVIPFLTEEAGCGEPAARAAASGESAFVPDIAADFSNEAWRQEALHRELAAAVALPLRDDRHLLGVLALYWARPLGLAPGELEGLEQIAADLARGIAARRHAVSRTKATEGLRRRVQRSRAREEADRALRQSEEMMRYIVKHDPNALAVFDRSMRYIAVSDRFLQDYGVTHGDVLGKSHYEVFPEIPEVWRQVHARALNGEVVRNDDDFFVRPDGSITYNRWECRPWRQADGTIGGIIMYTEVTTARKKMELALQEEARRKDAFLAMLGHELRNPLAPIRNANRVLATLQSGDPRGRQACAIIERQVAHLVRLVDDLLDVSRIARGKIVLRRELVDLVQLVRCVAEDFRAETESRGLRLSVSLPDGPVWVQGDPARLSQVLSNLLGNGRKFTDPGGSIDVILRAGEPAGQVELTVRDTGIGMAPAVVQRLFEPFVQAGEGAESEKRGGLGVGLALVRGLVQLHGGSVQAFSPGLNLGSTLVVRLPIAEAPSTRAPAPQVAARALARSLDVLIIEDDADAAESLRMVLEMEGCRVSTAGDARQGLRLARETRPDLVLCDIGLPGSMDGYEVARALSAEPSLRDVWLVAMTGYGRDEDRRRAIDAGFHQHLVKPVDPQVLVQVLEQRSRTPAPNLR